MDLQWVIPIISFSEAFNYIFNNKFFIASFSSILIENFKKNLLKFSKKNFETFNESKFSTQNGGCSSVVERAVVVRVTRVRFSPSACLSLRSNYRVNGERMVEYKSEFDSVKFVKTEQTENIKFSGSPSALNFTKIFGGQNDRR